MGGKKIFFFSLPPLPFPSFDLSSTLRVAISTLAVRMRKLLPYRGVLRNCSS